MQLQSVSLDDTVTVHIDGYVEEGEVVGIVDDKYYLKSKNPIDLMLFMTESNHVIMWDPTINEYFELDGDYRAYL